MTETVEILIVGAGIAGLSAGQKLKRNGYDVRIIEARTRIGGRVFPRQIGANLLDEDDAKKFPIVTVECGANWIHGLDSSNPIYRLAQTEGFNLVESIGDDGIDVNALIADRSYFKENGVPKLYSKEDLQCASEYHAQLQLHLAAARRRVSKKRATVRNSTTPRDVLRRLLNGTASSGAQCDDRYIRIVQWLHEQQGIAEAKDLDMIR